MAVSFLYYGRGLLASVALIAAADAQSLVYSTYLGGSGSDIPHAMTVDSAGNVYVTGETFSADFPVTAGVFQSRHAGQPGTNLTIGFERHADVFIAKLSPDASKVIWSTYLGGSRNDVAHGIAVDPQGNVYVAGGTTSQDFPVTQGAFQTRAIALGSGQTHGFVTKLNPSGTALVYSTLLGGSVIDEISGLALDQDNNAIVTGRTASPNFPATPGAWQRSASISESPFFVQFHAFVTKVHFSGTALVYSTFLSGTRGSVANAVAVDGDGYALVAGSTASPDFPITPGAYDDTFGGDQQAFVTKIHPSGSVLVWSTFLQRDFLSADAISAGVRGAAYIAGAARGSGFVMGLSSAGEYVYSTILGGREGASPTAIHSDANGFVYVAGNTRSADFPVGPTPLTRSFSAAPCFNAVRTPFQDTMTGFNCGDAFVLKLDASGASILDSTLFGGNQADAITAIALDPALGVYVAGSTGSANLPVTQAVFQMSHVAATCSFSGSPTAFFSTECEDAFVAKLTFEASVAAAPLEVVNAASLHPGGIAPGELVRIRGANAAKVPVTFDGVVTPTLETTNGEVLVAAPEFVAGKRRVTVKSGSTSVDLDVVAVDPGLFSVDRSGQGQGAIVNQDLTVNGPRNPAAVGSAVQLYATGCDSKPSAWIGGTSADVLFAGTSRPAGLQQINVRVPAVAPGIAPVFVSCGRVVTTQAGVTISVGR